MLDLYRIEEFGESRVELLEAEIELLRATVEELDERLSRIARAAAGPPNDCLCAELKPGYSNSIAGASQRALAVACAPSTLQEMITLTVATAKLNPSNVNTVRTSYSPACSNSSTPRS